LEAKPATVFYHADANLNVTALVNTEGFIQARYIYDPFGNLLAKSGPLADANTYRFSSKPIHENSGLYYYGFRFYEPNLQRWINQDPLGIAGGLNVHTFVGNEPIDAVDLLGLDTANWPWIGPAVSAHRMNEYARGLHDADGSNFRDYNEAADYFKTRHGVNSDLTAGDLGALQGVASLTEGTSRAYLEGVQQLAAAGIVTKGARAGASNMGEAADSGWLSKFWNWCQFWKKKPVGADDLPKSSESVGGQRPPIKLQS
jgi:RHS repeat-associated protein